jgi:hypothetical protein
LESTHVPAPGTPYATDWPNTLAICSVLKLETPANVKEWLEFYKYSGVDKIYLQENDSTSLLTDMLGPYIAEGFVYHELREGPVNPGQSVWYNECAKKAAEDFMSWVAFLDLDEFAIVLRKCASQVFADPSVCARVCLVFVYSRTGDSH